MLDSSIWPDRIAREVFITALLMAQPHELLKDTVQIKVDSLDPDGEVIPAGWYGIVEAAGIGIITRAMLSRQEGMEALKRLCSCDPESRSEEHCGKRMARINGGYLVLNYDKYRMKDHTTAERSKRYREKKKRLTVTRDITQAEVEGEVEAKGYPETEPEGTAYPSPCDGDGGGITDSQTRSVLNEEIYSLYPRPKRGEHKEEALRAIEHSMLRVAREKGITEVQSYQFLKSSTIAYANSREVGRKIALAQTDKIPMAKNWYSDGRYND
jgi:hypothetical protein